jgi:uncharacterized protein (DUF1778 family)
VILDTVLESEEDEMRNRLDDDDEISHVESEKVQTRSDEAEKNFHPVPTPRTSLIKRESKEISEPLREVESSSDEMEVEIIIVNDLSREENPAKLKLQIINPDEMIEDIKKEIDQVLSEAQEKIESYEVLTSPTIDTSDKNVLQNQNFLSHLSDVLTKSPKITQTLQRVKSNEKTESFKRSKSYHTLKDVFGDSSDNEKIRKIEPLDISIPGTPVSSKHLMKPPKKSIEQEIDLSIIGTPVSSQNVAEKNSKDVEEEIKIENDEKIEITQNSELDKISEKIEKSENSLNEKNQKHDEKISKAPSKKLSNFTLQSATPTIPEVIKSEELPPETKNDFKEKLAKLLSNPPQMNIFNLRPFPRSKSEVAKQVQNPPEVSEEKEIKISEKVEEKPKLSTPKTPFALLTETMNRQRKIFDEVLKTIKNKSDEHAKET